MPSSLLPQTALADRAMPGRHGAGGEAGVLISELSNRALATVIARKGAERALADRVRAEFGLELPPIARRTGAGTLSFAWAGPGQWLVDAEGGEGHRLEARLREALGGLASVCDQSDGRALVRISGAHARSALAKSIPIDLHPTVFAPGHCALTATGHIGVHLWQTDDVPTFECAVFRSFAGSFWDAMVKAAEEFGVATSSALGAASDHRGLTKV